MHYDKKLILQVLMQGYAAITIQLIKTGRHALQIFVDFTK